MPGQPEYDWATYALDSLETESSCFYPGHQGNNNIVNQQQMQQQYNQQTNAIIDPALLQRSLAQQYQPLPAPLTPVTNLNRTRGYHSYIHSTAYDSLANMRPYIAAENHNSQFLWPHNKPVTKIHGPKGTPNDAYEVFHYDIGYAAPDIKAFVASALYNDMASGKDDHYIDKGIWDYLFGDEGTMISDVVFGIKFFSNSHSLVVVRTWKGDVVAEITGDSWTGAKDKIAIFVQDHHHIPGLDALIKMRLADLYHRMAEAGTLALAH